MRDPNGSQKRRRAVGLCPFCGERPEDGYVTCRKCIDHRRALYQQRKEGGKCPLCLELRESEYEICGECRKKQRPKNRVKNRENYLKLRNAVLDHYGRKCECCGEDEMVFLHIDHIGGAKGENKRTKEQAHLTGWLVKNNFPEGFRTLCANCNYAVRWGRICPHQLNKD